MRKGYFSASFRGVEVVAVVSAVAVTASVPLFMYRPDLILASSGFSAFSGINHILPWRSAPEILPCLQRSWTRRTDIPHFSAASFGIKYFIGAHNPSYKYTLIQSYTFKRIISIKKLKGGQRCN